MSFAEDLRRELEEARRQYAEPVAKDGGEALRFSTFEENREPKDMIAVDGSYSFLLNLSSWWLAMISVALLRY